MSDLRMGIIGYGLRSGLAHNAHRPGEGSRIVGVCDPRSERLDVARERYGEDIVTTGDVGELLAVGLDAVFVLSPDYLHEQHAVAALGSGVGVYLEKPMAISTAGCDRILTVAARTGAPIYVGHNMRHMPVIIELRRLIQDGAIGEVKAVWCRHFVGHGGDFYFKDWHAERAKSNGLLLQKGAHDIDVIHWLAGSYSRRVSAIGGLTVYGDHGQRDGERENLESYTSGDGLPWPPASQTGLNPKMDVEDLSMVLMTLENGVLASYQQCHYTPDYWRNYTILGDAGRIENIGDESGQQIRVWNTRTFGYSDEPDQVVTIPEASGGHGGADPRTVAEFLEHVRNGTPTVTSPIAAREAVAAGCAATESLRAGGMAVAIDPFDPAG